MRRYKRFLADVRLADGREITAHCANPGSMKTCIEPDAPVWLSESPDPRRKLPFTLEVVEMGSCSIFVNPVRANRLVEEAIVGGVVEELAGYAELRREVGFPQVEGAGTSPKGAGAGRAKGRAPRRSRVDFLLSDAQRPDCYVEVKNVTLALGQGRSAFPDAVTERGARHLDELIAVRRSGNRAVLLYCASRSDATSVEAAEHIDPNYARALQRARGEGVEVLAYRCSFTRAASGAEGARGGEGGEGQSAAPTEIALGDRIEVR